MSLTLWIVALASGLSAALAAVMSVFLLRRRHRRSLSEVAQSMRAEHARMSAELRAENVRSQAELLKSQRTLSRQLALAAAEPDQAIASLEDQLHLAREKADSLLALVAAPGSRASRRAEAKSLQ